MAKGRMMFDRLYLNAVSIISAAVETAFPQSQNDFVNSIKTMDPSLSSFEEMRYGWVNEIRKIIPNRHVAVGQSYEDREQLYNQYINSGLTAEEKFLFVVHLFAGRDFNNLEDYQKMAAALSAKLQEIGFTTTEVQEVMAGRSAPREPVQSEDQRLLEEKAAAAEEKRVEETSQRLGTLLISTQTLQENIAPLVAELKEGALKNEGTELLRELKQVRSAIIVGQKNPMEVSPDDINTWVAVLNKADYLERAQRALEVQRREKAEEEEKHSIYDSIGMKNHISNEIHHIPANEENATEGKIAALRAVAGMTVTKMKEDAGGQTFQTIFGDRRVDVARGRLRLDQDVRDIQGRAGEKADALDRILQVRLQREAEAKEEEQRSIDASNTAKNNIATEIHNILPNEGNATEGKIAALRAVAGMTVTEMKEDAGGQTFQTIFGDRRVDVALGRLRLDQDLRDIQGQAGEKADALDRILQASLQREAKEEEIRLFIEQVKSKINEVDSLEGPQYKVLSDFVGPEMAWVDVQSEWITDSLKKDGKAHIWVENALFDPEAMILSEAQQKELWEYAHEKISILNNKKEIEEKSLSSAEQLYFLSQASFHTDLRYDLLHSPPLDSKLFSELSVHLQENGELKYDDSSFIEIKKILAEYLIKNNYQPLGMEFKEFENPPAGPANIRECIRDLRASANGAPPEAKEIVEKYIEFFTQLGRDPLGIGGRSADEKIKEIGLLDKGMNAIIKKAHIANNALGNEAQIRKSLELCLHFQKLKTVVDRVGKIETLHKSHDEYKTEIIDSRNLKVWINDAKKHAEGGPNAEVSINWKWDSVDRLLSGAGKDRFKVYPPMEEIRQGHFNSKEMIYCESTGGEYKATYLRLSDLPDEKERFGQAILLEIQHSDIGRELDMMLIKKMMDRMPDAVRILDNALLSWKEGDNPISITDVKRPEMALALQVLIESKGLSGKIQLAPTIFEKHEQYNLQDVSSELCSIEKPAGKSLMADKIKLTREKEMAFLGREDKEEGDKNISMRYGP